MKKIIWFLLMNLAVIAGCSEPESRIYGMWKTEGFDYAAEFSRDHTGTSTSNLGKAPFTWMTLDDGRIKITDPLKKEIFLRFHGDVLQIDGSNLTLVKIK
ncbi:hypothetical protein [Geobacter sp. AOG2]|uniref:hypothetical protein n=1 Tax=Geobacter sp. AOG2 TaxID=1566347 RepID=UPI001CC43CE3|nr:hypothetical protein [Geobacter sp. AOG2]GFE60358.1 hypothetical protein AOG2_09460 [Geobacter sp. AOG2]